MRMAFFDPSGITGFAFGESDNEKPEGSGVFVVDKKDPITKKMIVLEDFATTLIKRQSIVAVYIEEPILPKFTSFAAVSSISGLAMAVGMAATRCNCFAALVPMQTWRSRLGLPTQGPKDVLKIPAYKDRFGHLKSGLKDAKRQFVKDAAIAYATKRGFAPKDDNEGDALCGWFACKLKRDNDNASMSFDFESEIDV